MKKFDPGQLRRTVIEMAYAGSTVHIGCAFSIVEVLAVLYRTFLRYPDNDPNSEARDYLILSKGHGVMAQYACMKEMGWLTEHEIQNYFADGSALKGLSDSRTDGLEVTSGSLGHGFSVGVGLALGAKLNGTDQKVFTLVGDGEINEGPIWEGALFAAQHKLNNFIAIVDANGFQAMGPTKDILDLGDIAEKFHAFGFETLSIDGHNEAEIENAIHTLLSSPSPLPKALIAKTTKGKGVAFMENENIWHYTRLNQETYEQSLLELKG